MIRNILSKCLIIGALTMCNSAFADYCFPSYVGAEAVEVISLPAVNNFTVSPLFGKATMKQGTVKQDGWLFGIRGNYDIISINTLYLGAEAGYKAGELKGKTENLNAVVVAIDPLRDVALVENKTKSKYSDLWGEIRVGFTFGGSGLPGGYLSPYFVVGYEKEKDDFVSPSLIELKHTLTYGYLGFGAISNFAVTPFMSVGLNAKFKWMFNAYTKTGGDPYLQDKGISCANCFHWSIEVPVTYLLSSNLSFSVAPFYEYKNYDKHKFEWIGKEKASFHMWGGLVQLGYWF